MLLTREQLEILTGYKQKSAQVRALRRMGVKHVIRPDGRPVVDDSVLRGENVSHEAPKWDAR
ncbi:MAG: DUF4224 domain-containing protein [Chromatiales bacterium]|nr:DUF4224 domain-containing protein [Gammaproteobacteria bacterium]MCP5353203.1 DUF4224 domain-containing protein [Chromatiales bacterium]